MAPDAIMSIYGLPSPLKVVAKILRNKFSPKYVNLRDRSFSSQKATRHGWFGKTWLRNTRRLGDTLRAPATIQ
jgi:hypothetical protein